MDAAEDGDLETGDGVLENQPSQSGGDQRLVEQAVTTAGNTYLVFTRSATANSQQVGLTDTFFLRQCISRVAHGREICRFVKEATTQERLRDAIALHSNTGVGYSEQLLDLIYDMLPTWPSVDPDAEVTYRERIVYRLVHLGLERCCQRGPIPALSDEDLRVLKRVLTDADARRQEEQDTAHEATPQPQDAPDGPHTRSRSSALRPPLSTIASTSVPVGGMQASGSSAAVNPARGDTVQSDATAPLPRGRSNVAPRIRDAPGDSAARHRLGTQTTPRARAAMNASWTSAQANVGSGSRSTARNHEDRHTRGVQAGRMTSAFSPPEGQATGSSSSAYPPPGAVNTEPPPPQSTARHDGADPSDTTSARAATVSSAPGGQAPGSFLGTGNIESVDPPPGAMQDGTNVLDPVSASASAASRRDPEGDPPEIQLARAAIATFYRFRVPADLAPPLATQLLEKKVETYDMMQMQLSGRGVPHLPLPGTNGHGLAGSSANNIQERATQHSGSRRQDPPAGIDRQTPGGSVPAATLPPPPPPGSVYEQAPGGATDRSSFGLFSADLPGPAPGSGALADVALYGATLAGEVGTDPAGSVGIPRRIFAAHPNRRQTSFSYAVEEILNKLAARVVDTRPTVGHMRGTISLFDQLKNLVPAHGGLASTLGAASIAKGNVKTFTRNKKLLAKMGSIPDDADFFDEVKKIRRATVNAAAAVGGSSAGT